LIVETGSVLRLENYPSYPFESIPFWKARLFRVRYSAKESECILVRQLDRFYVLHVIDGEPGYREVPADKNKERFERLLADSKGQFRRR